MDFERWWEGFGVTAVCIYFSLFTLWSNQQVSKTKPQTAAPKPHPSSYLSIDLSVISLHPCTIQPYGIQYAQTQNIPAPDIGKLYRRTHSHYLGPWPHLRVSFCCDIRERHCDGMEIGKILLDNGPIVCAKMPRLRVWEGRVRVEWRIGWHGMVGEARAGKWWRVCVCVSR